MRKPRMASMFAGIGGICSGFKQAGCDIVWANELDAAACRTYRHNFGGAYLSEGDIRKTDIGSIPDFDILAAGFPCQAFSIGGTQRGFDDDRGALFFEVIRILDLRRPRFVFLENVENLIQHENGKTFLAIYSALAGNDYTVRYKVMATNEYGNVPQARKRLYIVAFRDLNECDAFSFPESLPLEHGIGDIVNPCEQKSEVFFTKTTPTITSEWNHSCEIERELCIGCIMVKFEIFAIPIYARHSPHP